MRFVTLLTSVACVGALTIPTVASAQAVEEPAEAPTPTEAPAEEAAPVTEAPAEPTTAEAEAPVEEAAATEAAAAEEVAPEAAAEEEEGSSVDGWFRVDHDSLNLQLWFGATHSLGPVDIATDVYIVDGNTDDGAFGEFDIGPWFEVSLGGENTLGILPMAGIGFTWQEQRATTLIAPQLFLYLTVGPVYWESWTQTFLNSVFTEDADDSLYLRNFVLYSISDQVAIGPQVEMTFALNNTDDSETVDPDTGDTITLEGRNGLESLPVGGRINLGYGENNTLGLFLGYETQEDARGGSDNDRAVAGRITFIRTW